MTMGQRILQARLDAGLSQRQLAGDVMTRNMLSTLEHDGANPSVATLKYLSEKLCKPIGYFLGEELPGEREMETARRLYTQGEYEAGCSCLEAVDNPVFHQERVLLEVLCMLEAARKARLEKRLPYSRELLRRCAGKMDGCIYITEELRCRWLLESAASAEGKERRALAAQLPQNVQAITLRAEALLESGQYERADNLLQTLDEPRDGRWNWLMGELHFARQQYEQAVGYYHAAEEEMPEQTAPKLEICYLETGNYKMAYYYAKKGNHGK